MRVKVISVSKKPEEWFETPAAVYVITGDDIRRSGATSIAEALRLAPGVDVARNDAAVTAVGVRGFNSTSDNQLLVLMDGRRLNSPFNNGVTWYLQDTVLEDIERIEVIRGPGGTLWGTEAVNGIINIITKSSRDTQGLLVSAGGGTFERVFGTLRYGGHWGDDGSFRVYGKYFKRDDFVLPNGDEAHDGWDMLRGGFRTDWETAGANNFTVQGDAYKGVLESVLSSPLLVPPFSESLSNDTRVVGGNLLGRWTHTRPDGSVITLEGYYDRTERVDDVLTEDRDTFQIDFQHQLRFGSRQEIVWGLGYRLSHDDFGNSFSFAFDPSSRLLNFYSGFVQDEITLVPERLRLTLGTKIEHNDLTGWEIQPSGRLLWTPTRRQTAWTAVTRGVVTPARFERDSRYNAAAFPVGPDVALLSIFGNPNVDSEELVAYEIGYRVQPHERLFLDVAVFYNVYDRLVTLESQPTVPEGSHLLMPNQWDNKADGESYGGEVAGRWHAADWWWLDATYSYVQIEVHPDAGSADVFSEGAEGKSPRHQAMLRSAMQLPGKIEFDAAIRFVDELPEFQVPEYWELDARLAWKPNDNWEVAIVGQNLLHDHRPEFAVTASLQPTEVPRGVYGKVTWRY